MALSTLRRLPAHDRAQLSRWLLRLLWALLPAREDRVIIFCPACQRRVGYPKRPTWCSYCGEVLPDKPIIDHGGVDPVKEHVFRVTSNDARFLRSIRIDPELPPP